MHKKKKNSPNLKTNQNPESQRPQKTHPKRRAGLRCIGEMVEAMSPHGLAPDPARFGGIGERRLQLLGLPEAGGELSSGGLPERRPRARVHLPAGDWGEGPTSLAHRYPLPQLDAE